MSRLDDLLLAPLKRLRRRWAARLRLIAAYPISATLAATISVWFFFLIFPGLDLAASRRYFVVGAGFPHAASPLFQDLREFGISLTWYSGIFALLVLLFPLFTGGRRFILPARRGLFLAATLALGPGLLVNGVLKAFSGRPRPYDVLEFGGSLPFLPPGVWSTNCLSNCSFVSGEGSSSFWLVAFIFVVPKDWRRPVAIGTLTLALLLSWNRLAFGGHFLSDILMSWGLTFIIILACRRWLLRGDAARDAAFDSKLGRMGQFIAGKLRLRRG